MKKLSAAIVLFVIFIFYSAGPVLAEPAIPDLTGKWKTKNYFQHHERKGFFSYPEGDGQWVIKKQEGRFFYGERSYAKYWLGKSKVKEGFSGVISRDGKRIYLVDHDEDILIGDILPDGSIELIMMNDGDKNHDSKIGLMEIERAN